MRRYVVVGMVGILALVAAVASAQGPSVTKPQDGDAIGPALDVVGNLGHKGLIVVITDVYREDGGDRISSVPGIRHYTETDGSFAFRVATPRGTRSDTGPLTYKVRVFELKGPGNPGPETVITCHGE